jgi:hypothetical protein
LTGPGAPSFNRQAKEIVMRAVVIVLALTVLAGAPVLAGERRYVVVTPDSPAEFTLWTSYTASVNCARALLAGRDEREWCDVGVQGITPKVGMIGHGTEVELIEGQECRDMAHVRVLTGDLKGRVGCMVARALSAQKPD